MKSSVGWKLCAAASSVAIAAAVPSWAQDFPSRQIKIIVPTAAGGGFDITARVVGERLGPLLGQGVVVENRTGAGTLVGTEAAAKAAPDGYTLLMGAFSNFGLNSGLYPKLSYDPIADFKPISIVVAFPFVLVARNDLPHTSLKDVVAAARANPGAITYASGGRATGQHIAMVALEQLNKVSFNHVPYRGAQPAYQDMIGGRIDLMFDNVSTALAQIEGKAVRALVVSSGRRNSCLRAGGRARPLAASACSARPRRRTTCTTRARGRPPGRENKEAMCCHSYNFPGSISSTARSRYCRSSSIPSAFCAPCS